MMAFNKVLTIYLKGKGIENTYWLVGKEDFNKHLPVPLDIKG